VGCAGSFDDRAKKVTKAIAKILHHAGVKFAVLGTEESCTGDPAKRAGNEFLFQMQAMNNIMVMNGYEVTKIVTGCPHCFNTLKNEYPSLGGHYEVLHHSELLQQLIDTNRLKIEGGSFKGKKITYHDPCYLGRANDIYEAPRQVIMRLDSLMTEMKRSRANGLCCGAGGAQMFKEPEKGEKDVNMERTEEALEIKPDYIAVSCPFCMTMLSDGVKLNNKESEVSVKDIAELIAEAVDL
jgi:Fe-S oxidoreductase